MHIALITAFGAAFITPASAVVFENFTESFDYPADCYNGYCPDPIPGVYNALSWSNLTSFAPRSCGGVGPLGPQPDGDAFEALFNGPDTPIGYVATTWGAGPAYIDTNYTGSCVKYFNLKSFAWSCATIQPLPTGTGQFFNTTLAANCSMDLVGHTVGGVQVRTTVHYAANQGSPSACPYWYTRTSTLDAVFSGLPLKRVKFVPRVDKGYGYDDQVPLVALDTVKYSVANKTGCYTG